MTKNQETFSCKLKKYFKRILPFTMGLLIGAGLTRNKNVLYVLVAFILISSFFPLIQKKILNIKQSTDDKIEKQKLGDIVLNDTRDYIAEGNNIGYILFENWFPRLSIILGLSLLCYSLYLLLTKSYFNALQSFFMVIIYMILINILREVKKNVKNV